MRQDGRAGTPRPQQGPEDDSPFQFSDEREAWNYVVGRGRTKEQVASLVSSAQIGMALAATMSVLRETLWISSARGPASKESIDELPQEALLLEHPPLTLPDAFGPALSLGAFAVEVIASTRKLVVLAKQMREYLDDNPSLVKNLSRWTSQLQMIAAFTLHAAQTQELNPQLGHREMEAVALIVGYRPPKEEFKKATRRQEDNWRKLLEKVKAELLPALRDLTTAPTVTRRNATGAAAVGARR